MNQIRGRSEDHGVSNSRGTIKSNLNINNQA